MIAALVLTAVALPQGSPSVADLAWLAGCWESARGERHVSEQWMVPEGNTLLGMSRTVANGKTTEYEFLLIREGARGLEYVAKPSGQPEATFTSVRVSAGEVVFENPAHDFPTRIIYRRQSDGVTAAIEGLMNGQSRRIEFPYKPTSCGK
jgi:Domain of unknown function (DUF6265)